MNVGNVEGINKRQRATADDPQHWSRKAAGRLHTSTPRGSCRSLGNTRVPRRSGLSKGLADWLELSIHSVACKGLRCSQPPHTYLIPDMRQQYATFRRLVAVRHPSESCSSMSVARRPTSQLVPGLVLRKQRVCQLATIVAEAPVALVSAVSLLRTNLISGGSILEMYE